ncbi:MAG: flippase-like domain-containing protein [Magnetococcus sp. WYHC-3]
MNSEQPTSNKHTVWQMALPLLKILLGASLIVLLFRRQDIRWADIMETMANLSMRPAWLAANLLLVLGCLLFGAVRWWTALHGLGVSLTRKRTAALFLVGHFFNGFLPGSTGGDVARAFYVAREIQGYRTNAVMSIVLERLAGVAVLLLLAVIGLLTSTARDELPMLLAATGAIAAAIIAVLAGIPYLPRIANWPVLRQFAQHPRTGPLTQRIYAALRLCHAQPSLMLRLAGWSLLQHFCAIASWLTLAWGMGFACQTKSFLLLVPAVLTAQMLPITPGGLGVREGAAIALLPAAGMAPHEAVLVSLASFVTSLVWSAAGGLIFVLLKERPPKQIMRR